MDETKERKRRSQKAGLGRVTARVPAYGFMLVDSSEGAENGGRDIQYAPHPDQAKVVQAIYEKLVHEDWSLYQIAQYLEETDTPTRRRARHWNTATLSEIVRNPVYKGEFYSNRYYFAKVWSERAGKEVQRRLERPKDEWIKIEVPPIVSSELWAQAQERLKKKRKKPAKGKPKPPRLLNGLLECATCGYTYTSGGGTKAQPTPYYICSSRMRVKAVRETIGCDQPYVHAEVIEEAVWQVVADIVFDPDLLMGYLEKRVREVEAQGYEKQLKGIEEELTKCAREGERWDTAYAAEIIDLKEYGEKKKALKKRLLALEGSKTQIVEKLHWKEELKRKKETVLQALEKVRAKDMAPQVPDEIKRRILTLLIDRIVIDTERKRFVLEGVIRGEYHYDKE